jgi:hypothetical protein
MARKPTQPALYELLRPKGHVRALPPAPSHAPPPSQPPADLGGFVAGGPAGPGRNVKIPVGYVYMAIAVVLFVVVLAYVYGFASGERSAKDKLDQRRIEELAQQAALPKVDPLKAGETPPSIRSEGREEHREPARDGGGARPQRGTPAGDRRGETAPPATPPAHPEQDLGPAPGTDPRVPGLNYFVLAHTSTVGGQRIVEFCRRHGLDAHLVPDNNGSLRVVIVTPGFASGDRKSPEIAALESRIRAVGIKFRDAGSNNRDFGDAYPMKFKPEAAPASERSDDASDNARPQG